MRRALWILLSLIALVAFASFWLGEDPVPMGDGVDGARAALQPTAGLESGALASSVDAGPEAAERTRIATSITDYEQLLASVATGYTGRVVSAGGEPVPGIDVALLRISAIDALPFDLGLFAREQASPRLIVAEATTDPDGRFELTGVQPRGLCALRLAFAAVDTAPERFRPGNGTYVPVQQTPAPGEVVDLGDVRLQTGATLVGRVTDLEGPLAGALVRAALLPPLPFGAVPIERLRPDGALIGTPGGQTTIVEFPEWFAGVFEALPITVATSRADGTFTLHGVAPGTVVVAAIAPRHAGCLRQGVDCSAGQVVTLGDLFLPDGATTEILVVDRTDAPVLGARVFVAPMSVGLPVHVAEPAGLTNAAGVVRVEGLPLGRAIAAAQRDGDATWHFSEPGSAEGRMRVVMPGRHSLTLTVANGAGAAVANVEVRLLSGSLSHGVLELSLFGARQPTDLGRRLQRLEDGRLRIDDLDAGSWTLAIGAPGFAAQVLEVDLQADAERLVILRPARGLRVRTIDAAGEPVAAATIYSHSRGGSRAQRIVELPLPCGRTDRDGWCVVPDLPTEQTRITAMHPRHGQVHAAVNDHAAELVLQFAMPGSIGGVLTDGGRPPPPGRWVLVLERRYGKGPLERGAMPELPQLAMPDLEGRFCFRALQPGEWRVTAQDSLTDVGTVAGLVDYQARRQKILPWNKADVVLRGGENAEVSLDAIVDAAPFDGPGATVRGRVTINGLPAADAVVVGTSKVPDRRVTNRVDRGGGFDLGRVPAGELRLVVVPADVAESRLLENLFSHLYARDLRVEVDRAVELDIAIETGSAFGEVRDRRGVPAVDCRVVLYDSGGQGRSSSLRTMRTDSRGSFAFSGIPAGTYELRAEADGSRGIVRGVSVTSGSSVGPIDVAIVRLVDVSGRLVFDTPAPPPRSLLLLHPADGGPAVRVRVQPDGRFEARAVPEGSYRADVRLPKSTHPAGRIEVVAPATADLVLRVGG